VPRTPYDPATDLLIVRGDCHLAAFDGEPSPASPASRDGAERVLPPASTGVSVASTGTAAYIHVAHEYARGRMPLYIRDDEVRELASRVARARRVTVTDAVRHALQRELADIEDDVAARDRRLRERFARLDTMPDHSFGDDDMYDEFGLPR
jgi:hypothetical protein